MRFQQALKQLMIRLMKDDKTEYNDLFFHQRTEDEAQKHFKYRKPPIRNVQKQAASGNGRTRWVYLTSDGILQSINSPILIEQQGTDGTGATTIIHLARLGDNIADDAFTTISLEVFNSTVMALMKDDSASTQGFNRLDGRVAGLVKIDQSPVTSRELNWESDVHPNAPVSVCLVKIFPVPPGYESCNGHNIRTPLPDDTDTKTIWPPMRDWIHSTRHLYVHMDGNFLHAHTGIVAPSNFDDPRTTGTTKGVFYNDKQAMGTNLSSTTFTEAQSIPATHSLVKDNFALMEEQIKQAL